MAPDDFVSPPPDVPDAPAADWPQPYDPPLTPNLDDLGYYDPSWGQLYGYDPTDWYNYDLSGYNQYGFDFLGFDRWGYDRWGYDRWGYDRWGYNWAGCNWAGYNRNGWDRDGRNEWGQRRDHPGDPRNQDWYNRHHPYEQYYQWKFRNDDPVYHRTQWDHAHGFNPNLYQNWNMNRDWHHPRNRDWAPLAAASTTNANTHASSPVVNLNASLAQFISNDKTTSKSGPLMKDLADKSTRDFTRELNPRVTVPIWSQPPSALGKRPATSTASHQTSFAPPALTAPAPTAPPSKVSPGFTAPKLSPVPVYTPPKVAQPQRKPERTPANIAPGRGPNRSSGPMTIPPKTGSPNPAVAPPAEPIPVTPPNPAAAPPREHSAPQTNPVPQAPESEPRAPPSDTDDSKSHRSSGPHRNHPRSDAPAPRTQAPAPEAPVRQAPPPSTKHLLRRRPTWLQSGPSDRHRPYTRRRLLPRGLLLSHVRHAHQGHPSVQFRCADGSSTPTSIGPRLVGQRLRSQSDRCSGRPSGSMLQCHIDGSFGMCDGRVDERHRTVLGFDKHAELGAPEDYGLRAALDKVRDRSLELLPRSRQQEALGKLCVQRIVHVFLVFAFSDQNLQTVALPQTTHEVAAGHRVPTAEQPYGREPPVQDLACSRIDDVQERQIHSTFDPVISGMDGVAGQ